MFDDTHQKRVNTSLDKNPTITNVDGLDVRHALRRTRTGDQNRDGNPLIYALKGLQGYSIVPMFRKMFMDRAEEVLITIQDELKADCICAVPSSKPFCREFAELVSKVAGVPLLGEGMLRKRTVGEMLEQYGQNVPSDLNERATRAYKSQLSDWRRLSGDELVSMKLVDLHIRRCFAPLVLAGNAPQIAGKSVVVADDLFASGASMLAVRDALGAGGATVKSGITFLSGL